MKLLLMPNLQKENIHRCIRQLTALPELRGDSFLMDRRLYDRFSDCEGITFGDPEALLQECDICVAIGGDGTIIHEGKLAAAYEKPILGINLGRLGFLATLESDQLSLLSRLHTGDYTLEKRMMLRVTLVTPEGVKSWQALNDAVISKGGPTAHMVELTVENSGRLVNNYRADGLILSTPTGSTAYAMSAGGPIIDPEINCIALTPLSSHSLFTRPIVFADNSRLSICPAAGNTADVFLTIDGEVNIPIGPKDTLLIERSDSTACLINLTGKSYYDVLGEKLIWRATK